MTQLEAGFIRAGRRRYETPWGTANDVTIVAPGIVRVDTPSHGGYHVTGAALAKIPAAWRAASWNGQGARGWFEEDCDWTMVALTFPEHFPPEAQIRARQIFDGWIAPKLAKAGAL